jgi:hypothetical protein
VVVVPSFRNRIGAICAIIGGIFLVIAGGVGMAPLLEDLQEIVEDKVTEDDRVHNIFRILIYFAALGGISVILGGIMMHLEFKWAAKILIMLGAGIGIFGIIFGYIMAYMSGSAGQYMDALTSTIAGIGALLSIIAYYLAK